MNSHSGQSQHVGQSRSQGLVQRRSIGSIRREFIATCEPTLKALAEVERLCDELLKTIESEPLSVMCFDEEPETKRENGRRK